MKCPVCTAEIPSTAKFCGGCGATITPPKPAKPAAPPPKVAAPPAQPASVVPSIPPSLDTSSPGNVARKYKTLRLIAMLYKVLAFVSGGGCLLLALYLILSSFTSKPENTLTIGLDPTAVFGGAIGGLILLVFGSFLFIFLYGLGEWMYVFMDIEENTRKTNELLASKTRQATS
jgi:hypothetical protein